MTDLRIVLASGSPRRREILARLGYEFTVISSDCPEDDVTGQVEDMVRILARRKAESVAAKEKDALVIGADTLVCLDGAPLGKPADSNDAFNMLSRLSGKTHSVLSGICLINTRTGKTVTEYEETRVTFKPLTKYEIIDYIATGEPMDKAGAYAIQGGAAKFINGYTGSYDNIVGFPTELFTRLIKTV